MKNLRLSVFTLIALSSAGCAQLSGEVKNPAATVQGREESARTIEGFWQDTARRILYTRDAPPSFIFGKWDFLDQQQTYPSAKQIRRSGATYELDDLLYDGNYTIKVVTANEDSIEFVRSPKWAACSMRHRCRLDGDEMFCSLENICRDEGRDVLDWRGEERYAKRVHCERDGRVQAQGFPQRCR